MPTVVAITKAPRKRGLLMITFDDGTLGYISSKTVKELSIAEGKAFAPATWKALEKADEERRCRETIQRLLDRRLRTEKEMRQALRERSFPPELIDRVINELLMAGVLNDDAFAKLFTEQRRDRNYGPRRIESELKQRGIDRQAASIHAKAEEDEDAQRERALVAFTKWNRRSKPTEQRARAKAAVDFLLRRGFDYDVAFSIVQKNILTNTDIDIE